MPGFALDAGFDAGLDAGFDAGLDAASAAWTAGDARTAEVPPPTGGA